jgi:hypothetical protein
MCIIIPLKPDNQFTASNSDFGESGIPVQEFAFSTAKTEEFCTDGRISNVNGAVEWKSSKRNIQLHHLQFDPDGGFNKLLFMELCLSTGL